MAHKVTYGVYGLCRRNDVASGEGEVGAWPGYAYVANIQGQRSIRKVCGDREKFDSISPMAKGWRIYMPDWDDISRLWVAVGFQGGTSLDVTGR
jgi:hypothetical protein